eukprot:GFKZ01012558.1.p2 GENE.GFKZ01012558.1~~GFKZ01012558.1.p2  ORF type:complete len:292 (-),score=41.64 GFKZ01012558.1:1341-2216(-)
MSSSPAWLTIAFTTLCDSDTSPAEVLRSGLRSLPSPHILHHLNRWTRHVWRPAVAPKALARLNDSPDEEALCALGAGAVSLLAALMEAVRRCEVDKWVDVLGVMFLADDPWVVEVGSVRNEHQVQRAAQAMRRLYEGGNLVAEADSRMKATFTELGADAPEEESMAELRCRVAALQLQLDDVTAVVRRNEKNTKDLLSSFHFWSMLLLDEMRGYKSMVAKLAPPREASDGGFDNFVKGLTGGVPQAGAAETPSEQSGGESSGKAQSSGSLGKDSTGARPRRVFRDGKWVTV